MSRLYIWQGERFENKGIEKEKRLNVNVTSFSQFSR